MEVLDFKKELDNRLGITLDDTHTLFQTLELYDDETDNSVYFKTFDELLEYKINEKTIKELIEEREDANENEGGSRGATSSGSGLAGGSLFGGARQGGKKIISANGNSLPAYMNTLVSAKSRSIDTLAKAFGKKTLNALREYSGAVDEDGFVHKYAKGGKGSTPHLVKENGWSIHNHPTKDKNGKTIAWNIFSKKDLKNSALDKGRGTIVVANGNRTMYKFEKTKNFDANAFIKGMNKAKGATGNYDKDVDKWLKANQKQYGYKYTKQKF